MAHELVGRAVEAYRDPRIEADLPHEDKEREDRIAVVGDDIIDVPAD